MSRLQVDTNHLFKYCIEYKSDPEKKSPTNNIKTTLKQQQKKHNENNQ